MLLSIMGRRPRLRADSPAQAYNLPTTKGVLLNRILQSALQRESIGPTRRSRWETSSRRAADTVLSRLAGCYPGLPGVRDASTSVTCYNSPVDGIINFNKPLGITSAGALYKVRAVTRQRKSGHAGALDPCACGVLVLCMGRATKLVERVMNQPKTYRAVARLDVTSESFDSDRPLIPVPVARPPAADELHSALLSFQGEIEQTPPDISAVKVGGVPAYKRARRGQALALKPRPVRLYWLQLRSYDFPYLNFEMCCGRGTYVRSLIRDLGLRLNTGGCLTSLTRLRVGPFAIDDAWTLQALRQAADPTAYLIDVPNALRLLDACNTVVPPRPPTV